MTRPQGGFAALEGLLILVAAVIIIGAGYYVWRGANQSKQLLNNAAKVSGNAPIPLSVAARAKHYLSMYQWGVQGTYVGTLTLKKQYAIIANNGHERAYFTSSELAAADPDCTISSGAGGIIDKYAAGDRLSSGVTVESYIASGKAQAYSHAGKYYYVVSKSNIGCKRSAESQKLQGETYADVQSIARSLKTYCDIYVPACG